jgi:predicted DNA-binding transcriptional regulator AlpA
MENNGEKKMDRVMRLPEIATVMGLCVRSVRRKVDRGELPPMLHNGRTVGLFESEIKACLERMRTERGSQ